MVKRLITVVILTAGAGVMAEEMTYDQFVQEVGDANKKVDYSKRLVNKNELDKWIVDSRIQGATPGESDQPEQGPWMPDLGPEPKDGNAPDKDMPDAEKIAGDAEEGGDREENDGGLGEKPEAELDQPPPAAAKPKVTQKAEPSGPVRYVWKPKVAQGNRQKVTYSMNVEGPGDAAKFGIPIGTQIRVRLSSGATSVQPGLVKLTVLEDVQGMRKVLERGSTIFVRPNAVRGSDRLYAVAKRGITLKDNEEFSVTGNIFAEDGQPGFVAEVISDGEAVDRALDKGVKAVGEGLIGLIPGDSISLEAGKKAAGSVLDEADGQAQEERGRVKLVVQAQPQYAVLQIEETF